MKKQRKWVVGLGIVVLIVLAFLSRRESDLAELVPAAAGQTVEEPVSATAEAGISEVVGLDEQKDEVQQPPKTEKEESEFVVLPDAVKDEDSETNLEFQGDGDEIVTVAQETQPILIPTEEEAGIEKTDVPNVEKESEAEVLNNQENTNNLKVQELGAEEVDAIEDSLSVGDYARGLSLLAQLPAETVDRFVALRKDGFTAEEQAEVKEILLDSFEGEDLDWIVETYHKLQP